MFYGFRSPSKKDAVFTIAGDEKQVRLLDRAAREFFAGAVQSTKLDGIRHYYGRCTKFLSLKLASAVRRCRSYSCLRPLTWLLSAMLFCSAYLSVRAEKSNFYGRTFVKDGCGNFTLMCRWPNWVLRVRSVVAQMGLQIVAERLPPGTNPVILKSNGVAHFSVQVDDQIATFTL